MIEELIEAYLVARSTTRRSRDSVEFEIHYEANIIDLSERLRNHTYAPTTYTFIVSRPKFREVFACEMSLRIIDHYIEMRLRPILENVLSDRTFNNRKGKGGVKAINTLISDIYEVTEGFTKDAWIIKWDIAGYFPNAIREIAYNQLSDLIERFYEGSDKEELLYLTMVAIFSDPTERCERRSPLEMWSNISKGKSLFDKDYGIGGAIGRLLWQMAMTYYLNDIDHYITDNVCPNYCRFVDDSVIVTQNREVALSCLPIVRGKMAEVGCRMHPHKFYCQQATKGVEFLGTTIKKDRVYSDNRTIRNARKAVYEWNRRVRVGNIESFIASVNSYLGILKGRNEHDTIMSLVGCINPKWWRFVHFNEVRICLQANEGYRHFQLIERKYRIKLSRYGKKKKTTGNRGEDALPQVRYAG